MARPILAASAGWEDDAQMAGEAAAARAVAPAGPASPASSSGTTRRAAAVNALVAFTCILSPGRPVTDAGKPSSPMVTAPGPAVQYSGYRGVLTLPLGPAQPDGTGRSARHEEARVELMTSGAFARASGLSRKALRLYDELGLLHPARVDPPRCTGSTIRASSSRPGWWRGCAAGHAAGRHPRGERAAARPGGRGAGRVLGEGRGGDRGPGGSSPCSSSATCRERTRP